MNQSDFSFSPKILAVAVASAMTLSACLGGGGSGTAATSSSGTALTVAPVKGKFSGTCTVQVATTANPTQPIVSGLQTMAADGTVSVTLPAGSTGPFVISILGDASGNCKYFNDSTTNPQNIPFGSGQNLNALVPSNQISGNAKIVVDALTESAYQAVSAANGGNVNGVQDNDSRINTAIVAALQNAGISSVSVTNFFTPPATIPASGVAASDDLGRALVKIARQNPGDELKAINANALLVAAALLNQTNAASANALTNDANMLAASFVPETGAESFASHVRAVGNIASAVANAAASTQFLGDITSASGLRDFQFGYSSPSYSQPAYGSVIKATLANAVYTVARTFNKLVNGTWTAATGNNWVLTASGWADDATTPITFSLNNDGTLQITQAGKGSSARVVSMQNLNGVPVASLLQQTSSAVLGANATIYYDASGVPTTANSPVSGVFGAGAYLYSISPVASSVASQDIYQAYTGASMSPTGLDYNSVYADQGSTPLASLPTGAFCMQGNYITQSASSPAGTFDVFPAAMSLPCSKAPNAVSMGTITASPQTVNGQTLDMITAASAVMGSYLPFNPNRSFIAVVNGAVHGGFLTKQGAPLMNTGGKVGGNSTAAQQLENALGTRLPPL